MPKNWPAKQLAAPTRPHVVVSIFTEQERRGWVHPVLTAAVLSIAYNPDIQMSYVPIHSIHPISAARNRATDEFFKFDNREDIRSGDWLAMFDNDIGPPLNVGEVFINAPEEADIVILPYWVWTGAGWPMICVGNWVNGEMITPDVGELKPGWNEYGVGGTGAMFIRRRVFTDGRLQRPFFQIRGDAINGQVMTEDIDFTSRAKEAGFRIFTNTDYVCSHYRTIDIAEVNMGINRVILNYTNALREKARKLGIDLGTITEECGNLNLKNAEAEEEALP